MEACRTSGMLTPERAVQLKEGWSFIGRRVEHHFSFAHLISLALHFFLRSMGMEACCTLGMLTPEQAVQLKEAGLTAYNHNLDTSREFYPQVITTRTYDERLQTIANARNAGISVCSGE